jgi:protein-disulfide isomerase-like protein with CxxC motif
MVENWTELIVGIIMIISPWVFGFSDISVARWCNVLLGIVLVLVNAGMIFGERAPVAPVAEAFPAQEHKKKRILKNNVEPKITI